MKHVRFDPAKTLLTITVVLVLLYLIYGKIWLLWAAFGLGFTGLLSGTIARGVNYLWEKLTFILGLIIPNIILGIIYYLFLTPIAIAQKLFTGSDPLDLKKPANTNWKITGRTYDSRSFHKTW